MTSARFIVCGRVQGVFFRASARREAVHLGIDGYAKNLGDGSVELLAHGSSDALVAFERWLKKGPPGARVDAVEREASSRAVTTGFDIL